MYQFKRPLSAVGDAYNLKTMAFKCISDGLSDELVIICYGDADGLGIHSMLCSKPLGALVTPQTLDRLAAVMR